MPFYPADFLADTMHLSAAEVGAYMLLIMHYWQRGGLPNDDERVRSIARILPEQWSSSRAALAELFNTDWTHDRIDAELVKADEKYRRRAEAGRAGGNANAARKQSSSNASSNAAAKTYQPQPHSIPKGIEDADASVPSPVKVSREAKPTPKSILQTVVDEKRASALVEHRKKLRAPLTDDVARLLADKLARYADPNAAADVIMVKGWKSIEPDWGGAPPLRSISTQPSKAAGVFVLDTDPIWTALVDRYAKLRGKTPAKCDGRAENGNGQGWYFPADWIAELKAEERAA